MAFLLSLVRGQF